MLSLCAAVLLCTLWSRQVGATLSDRASAGLLLYYPFMETGGSVASNAAASYGGASLSGQDLDLGGSALLLPTPGVSLEAAGAFLVSQATNFNDLVGGFGGSQQTAFTLEIWAAPTSAAQTGAAIVAIGEVDTGTCASDNSFRLMQDGTAGSVDLAQIVLSRVCLTVDAPAMLSDTAPHHVVFTSPPTIGAPLRIYVDGVLASNLVDTLQTDFLASNAWDVGRRMYVGRLASGAAAWSGTVYQLAVYDRALSAAEVANNYAVGAVNAVPTTTDVSVDTSEDIDVVIQLPGNDTDPTDVGDVVAYIESLPSGGDLYQAVPGSETRGPAILGTPAIVTHPDRKVVFAPHDHFWGVSSFTYFVSDSQDNSAASIATVVVNPLNDLPTVSGPASVSGAWGTPLAVTGIVATDHDADDTLIVSLSTNGGLLTLDDLSGLSFSVGDGTGDTAVVFSGSLTGVARALAEVTYLSASSSPIDRIYVSAVDAAGFPSLPAVLVIDILLGPPAWTVDVSLPAIGTLTGELGGALDLGAVFTVAVEGPSAAVVISAGLGRVAVTKTAGVTVVGGTDTAGLQTAFQSALTLQAVSSAAANAALATLVYTAGSYSATSAYTDVVTVTIANVDMAHAGVASVAGSASISMTEPDQVLGLTAGGSVANGVVSLDVEVSYAGALPSSEVVVVAVVEASHGTVAMGTLPATLVRLSSNGGRVAVMGVLDAVVSALASATVTCLDYANDALEVTVTVYDNRYGTAGGASVSASVPLPGSGPSVEGLEASLNAEAGGTVTISGVSVASGTDSSETVRARLLATNGLITTAFADAALTFVVGDGTADSEIVVSGPKALVDVALQEIAYTPIGGGNDGDGTADHAVTIYAGLGACGGWGPGARAEVVVDGTCYSASLCAASCADLGGCDGVSRFSEELRMVLLILGAVIVVITIGAFIWICCGVSTKAPKDPQEAPGPVAVPNDTVVGAAGHRGQGGRGAGAAAAQPTGRGRGAGTGTGSNRTGGTGGAPPRRNDDIEAQRGGTSAVVSSAPARSSGAASGRPAQDAANNEDDDGMVAAGPASDISSDEEPRQAPIPARPTPGPRPTRPEHDQPVVSVGDVSLGTLAGGGGGPARGGATTPPTAARPPAGRGGETTPVAARSVSFAPDSAAGSTVGRAALGASTASHGSAFAISSSSAGN